MQKPQRANHLPVIDEALFYRLLEGPGRVRIDVVLFEDCYLPFVSFNASIDMPDVHYGVIVRNGTDLIAGRTVEQLISLLGEMTEGRKSAQIELPLPGFAMALRGLPDNEPPGSKTIAVGCFAGRQEASDYGAARRNCAYSATIVGPLPTGT